MPDMIDILEGILKPTPPPEAFIGVVIAQVGAALIEAMGMLSHNIVQATTEGGSGTYPDTGFDNLIKKYALDQEGIFKILERIWGPKIKEEDDGGK